jgi:hypothetical protein
MIAAAAQGAATPESTARREADRLTLGTLYYVAATAVNSRGIELHNNG